MLKRVRFFVSLFIFGLVAFCDWVKCAVKIKMGTLIDNSDGNGEKRDLDDSGCVQDGSAMEPRLAVSLLDLSDDVLLYILRHCSPRDLKALGFSCARLGRLIRERSLWRDVDARAECCGVARLDWYVANALHADTRRLAVRGYAEETSGCLGMLNCSRQEAEEEQKAHQGPKAEGQAQSNGTGRRSNFQRHHTCLYMNSHCAPGLPRYRGTPLWPCSAGAGRERGSGCCGPRFTVSPPLLTALRARCHALARLALERCNVDCNTISLSQLPPTLTHLSLRGTRCYNLPLDKSFLFRIQDHLPLLEWLDVSECEWLEPAALLPLSKLGRLRELRMRDCAKLAEFVAYASLASRYGFRTLQCLDLRGSPVGDSEVASLAWLPRLEELRLAAGAPRPAPALHGHYVDDAGIVLDELDSWETQVPDYLKPCDRLDGEAPPRDRDRDRDRPDGEGAGDGEGEDDDDDMNGGGASAIPKPSLPPEQGESSKGKRDSTKRKAENGSGDAGVNGEQSKSKRKRCDKHDSSSDDDSKDSEEEMYEKRRCQTIVIVDRRYITENEDISFGRFARRLHGELRNQRLEAEIARARERENNAQQNADSEESKAKTDEEKTEDDKNKSDDKKDEEKRSNDDKVNEGASTSKEQNDKAANNENKEQNNGNNERPNGDIAERYIRFRHGENPVIVNLAERPERDAPERIVRFNSYNIRHEVIDNQQIFNVEIERCSMHGIQLQPNQEGNGGPQEPQNQRPEGQGPQNQRPEDPNERQYEGFHQAVNDMQREEINRVRREQNPHLMNLIRGEQVEPPPLAALPPQGNEENWEPRHRVLYVNVGQPFSAAALPSVIQGLVSDRDISRGFNPSSLITDAAVMRFGRAAGNDIRFVLVGLPHPMLAPNDDGSARPERSNLRVLVMNGYRNITDRSLEHLATAAPHLQYLDFRETNVTPQGVENFRSLRPDCEVLFSPYVARKDQWPDEDD